MKKNRQRKILELINECEISTQEELVNKLKECNYPVTQATVSRDIRELNLKKINGSKGKKFGIGSGDIGELSGKYRRVLADGIISIEDAENILVLKTVSGMAMAVGAAVDAIKMHEIIGCIAGDDTVMCVARNSAAALSAKKYLERALF